MKNIFITFATKNQCVYSTIYDAGLRIQKQAQDIGIFDECILYTEDFLKENDEFWSKHKDFLEKNKKGYGFYIWKPYIIKKTMEMLNISWWSLYLC